MGISLWETHALSRCVYIGVLLQHTRHRYLCASVFFYIQRYMYHNQGFLNPNWTVRSNWETLKPFTSMERLRWRTIPCEKSMDPSKPQSDRTVLWTVTDSHSLNSCLVSSLKTAPFHLFFFPPIQRRLKHTHWTNLTLKWNPRLTLSITLYLFLTFSITLSFLPLYLIIAAAQPRLQLILSITFCLSLTLISASLPRHRCSSLSASSLSSSFGTLSVLILLSFMSIFIFCPIFKGNQVYFSNKNNNQERERKKIQSVFLVHYSLLICYYKDLWFNVCLYFINFVW